MTSNPGPMLAEEHGVRMVKDSMMRTDTARLPVDWLPVG
jgi:hypothetical protein